VKLTVSDFTPPVALAAMRKLFPPAPPPKSYATYAEALADCPDGGYERPDLVEVVLKKTRRLCSDLGAIPLTSAAAFSLCGLLGGSLGSDFRVLDFGGACGAHYFQARAMLPPTWRLRWVVVETPSMARAAKELSDDGLTFTTSVDKAATALQRVDVVHASAALQYVADPLATLEELLSVGAQRLLLNRLLLSRGDAVIQVQESPLSSNGPGPLPDGIMDRRVRYPRVLPSAGAFYRLLNERYDLLAILRDPSVVISEGEMCSADVGVLARLREGAL